MTTQHSSFPNYLTTFYYLLCFDSDIHLSHQHRGTALQWCGDPSYLDLAALTSQPLHSVLAPGRLV